MGPGSRNLNFDLTYWGPTPVTNDYGVITYDNPQLIKGRIEQENTEVSNINGQIIISKTVAYTDRDLEEEGYLIEGDYTAVADPSTIHPSGARKIQAFKSTPDLRNLSRERKAFL